MWGTNQKTIIRTRNSYILFKTSKFLTISIVSIFLISCNSFEVYKLNHFSYKVPKNKRVESKVIQVKKINTTDTNIAIVRGHIFDLTKENNVVVIDTIRYGEIVFSNSTTPPNYATTSKMQGEYEMKLIPGTYKIWFTYVCHYQLIVNEFSIKAGEIKELDIGLGLGPANDSIVYRMTEEDKFIRKN